MTTTRYVENVQQCMTPERIIYMVKKFAEAGYDAHVDKYNSADYLVPQERIRMWLHGRLLCQTSPGWKERFSEAMEDMKQEHTYPLDKFLLPSDSDALTGVRNERASKIGKKGVKWLADHWVSRVTCGVSPPTHVPLELQQVIALESLSEREADMLKIYHQNHWSLASMAGTRQAIELKHSLLRPEP